jgi:hypothetical protein
MVTPGVAAAASVEKGAEVVARGEREGGKQWVDALE